MIVSTDPDAQRMEAAIRFPGYTVTRARNGVGKRWLVRRHTEDSRTASNYVRRMYGDVCGAMNGYTTEARAWRIVSTLVASTELRA